MSNKSEYKDRFEWKKHHPKDYDLAKNRGCLEEICKYFGWELPKKVKLKPSGYWTKERCIEDAKKYDTRSTWAKFSSSAYTKARRGGFFKECVGHMKDLQKPSGYWTKERCMEEAKRFKTKEEWKKGSLRSHSAARTNGWYHECAEHMIKPRIPSGYWTKERCMEDAKKYNSRWEWQKECAGSYGAAFREGWIEECAEHMEYVIKPKGYWTKERCIEDAMKYNNNTEWRKFDQTSYNASAKKGWLKEMTKLRNERKQIRI